MTLRTAVRIFSIVPVVLVAGCGGGRSVSGLVPTDGPAATSAQRGTLAAKQPLWRAVALNQTIATVGGATSTISNVWVSDAAAGSTQRVNAQGSTVYPSGVAHVYGLTPVPHQDIVIFDYGAGYGAQEATGSALLYPVPMPAGEALVPGEITYLDYAQAIFLGGSATTGAVCRDAIYVVPAGGSSPFDYFGDPGSAPCGTSLQHLASDGAHLWFGEANTSPKHLSYFTPSGPSVTDYALPGAASTATPEEVTAGTNGNVYFSLCGAVDTHPGGGAYLVRVNASSPNETLFSTYAPCAQTTNSMVYDAYDGRVWIANGTNTLTAVRISDGAVSSYALTNPAGASSGFVTVTVGPDTALWAFRNGDGIAHAYPDEIIAADPSYAYTLHGQPVTVHLAEYNYAGNFIPSVVAGSGATCAVTPVPGGSVLNTFNVAAASGTACTIAFSDTLGIATVYVPVVTRIGSGVPPQPQAP
jgi:hypothetical protein